jgi:hypothetical protein
MTRASRLAKIAKALREKFDGVWKETSNWAEYHTGFVVEQWERIKQEYAAMESDKTIIIKKDGNKWCAHREDFVNLQESNAGFGDDPHVALANLVLEERQS